MAHPPLKPEPQLHSINTESSKARWIPGEINTSVGKEREYLFLPLNLLPSYLTRVIDSHEQSHSIQSGHFKHKPDQVTSKLTTPNGGSWLLGEEEGAGLHRLYDPKHPGPTCPLHLLSHALLSLLSAVWLSLGSWNVGFCPISGSCTCCSLCWKCPSLHPHPLLSHSHQLPPGKAFWTPPPLYKATAFLPALRATCSTLPSSHLRSDPPPHQSPSSPGIVVCVGFVHLCIARA